jgi:uncharacterized repeat protein (TIGR04002 family)
MKKQRIKNVCLAATFTAIVFVLTAYLQIPSHTGYIHIGDSFIMLSACLLPTPYAVFVGAGGAVLADCLTGYALWAPASVVIKALTALMFTNKKENIINLRNLLAIIPSFILCIGGYYIYEAFISGNFIAPLSGMLGSLMQSLLSGILFVVLGITFDKLKIKKFIL